MLNIILPVINNDVILMTVKETPETIHSKSTIHNQPNNTFGMLSIIPATEISQSKSVHLNIKLSETS